MPYSASACRCFRKMTEPAPPTSCRPTPDSDWLNGRGIVVKRTRYENGNLFQLGFEDKVILDDFNDLIVEVAIIQPA